MIVGRCDGHCSLETCTQLVLESSSFELAIDGGIALRTKLSARLLIAVLVVCIYLLISDVSVWVGDCGHDVVIIFFGQVLD